MTEKSYFKIVPHFCVISIFSSTKSFYRKQCKNCKCVTILLAGLKEERNILVELVNSHLTGGILLSDSRSEKSNLKLNTLK